MHNTPTATPSAPIAFRPFAIMFQFPSGEWSVEHYQTDVEARIAAGAAATEAAGRIVHVMKRECAVVQPPNVLAWSNL